MRAMLRRIIGMRSEARWIMRSGFLAAGALYLAALTLAVRAGPFQSGTYDLFMGSKNLESSGIMTLFLTIFAAAIVEERLHNKK